MAIPPLPKIIYGTAWKQDATAGLVKKALEAGYRAFDTANQKKHYREDYAGAALREFPRGELFLQSKFTFVNGQDSRLPYDPNAPFAEQVRSSLESTLAHFGTDYLDCFLLHGPSSQAGLTEADWEVWEAMTELRRDGRAGRIGVSNVGLHHLKELMERAPFKPELVQNRCYALRGWDRGVREFCLENGIAYEGFSLLTANPQVVTSRAAREIARRLGATAEQVVFRFAVSLGILPLTGTTDSEHMRQDIEALSLELSPTDLTALSSA